MTNVTRTNAFDRAYQKHGKVGEIAYHTDRLSKRRDKEKEEKTLNAFLHSSLRSSDRLKSLEKTKMINYKVNMAYVDEGMDAGYGTDVISLMNALCARKNTKTNVSPDDLDWLQTYVRQGVFQASYDTCIIVSSIINKYYCPTLPHTSEACLALGVAIDLFSGLNCKSTESHYKYQIQELLQILSSPELQSLLDANDGYAKIIEDNAVQRHKTNLIEPHTPGISVDDDLKDTEICRSEVTSRSSQDTCEVIRSSLVGCYAKLHPSENGVTLKTVVLEKGTQPLGVTVHNEREAVVIGRIVVGGVAHKSALLKEGNELLSVNGMELTGKDVDEVSDILARMTGTLVFTVACVNESTKCFVNSPLSLNIIVHLRALYSYNPNDDLYIPCKDIGLGFERGDILHVTNVNDPNWWQAYKDIDGVSGGSLAELAGLIPSPDYQYKRVMLRRQLGMDNDSMNGDAFVRFTKHKKKKLTIVNDGWSYNVDINGRASNPDVRMNMDKHKHKHKKKMSRASYCPRDIELNNPDQSIITYEEVEIFLPQPHRKRPLVLIGSELIGRNTLIKALFDIERDQLCLVKQHNTIENQSENKLYVTKDEFRHIQNMNEFIETAVFEKNLYGTNKREIKKIIDSGKTAVIVLQPESLDVIRKTSFLPYVIFVRPPTKIDAFRTLLLGIDQRRYSDDELFRTIGLANTIDFKFGHMFDVILVIESLKEAAQAIMDHVNSLDRDAQWVPSSWLSQRPASPFS